MGRLPAVATPEQIRLADKWGAELENHSGLIFGHMCMGEKFLKGSKANCRICKVSYLAPPHHRSAYDASYDWHVTEEEYIFILLKQ